MHAIAIAIAAFLFLGFLHGGPLDSFLQALMLGLYEYKLAVVLIATSPLLASLLVGFAYTQRAIRRRRATASVGSPAASRPSPGR